MEDFRDNPRTDFDPVEDLSETRARREARALRDGIDYHDRKYYVDNDPVIADSTHDRLLDRLEELEEAFPGLRDENSPTARVGAPPSDALEQVEHAARMLSLDATTEERKVRAFLRDMRAATDDFAVVLEPKFDGLSVEAVYEDGAFTLGATRGDGRVGEDITDTMRTIRSLPLRLAGDPPKRLAVRGEVLMPKNAFQKLNRRRIEQGRDAFANPRNAAAGATRRLDPRGVAEYPLDVYFYDILEMTGAPPGSQWARLDRLADWGFKVSELNRCETRAGAVADRHEDLAQARDDLDIEIDGMVIKLDDTAAWTDLGARSRAPRYALAWKFEPRAETTRLVDIVVQVGMTGILTPVALLDPVEVDGATISRASLHNQDIVRELDARPGDRVRIARAGDVIPEVREVIETADDRSPAFTMPDRCPVCDARLQRQAAHVVCPNGMACRAQLVGHLAHLGGRAALDIDGLGEKTARRLVEAGLVEDIADVWSLEAEDVAALDGFADRSARRLVAAIRDARRPRLDRFLFALGIVHLGETASRAVARSFGDWAKVAKADRKALRAVKDVGPKTADSLHRFLRENRDSLERMAARGVRPKSMPRQGDLPLSGKTFVFTGALTDFTRDEAKRAVEDLGADATTAVSGNTDYVVVGDDPGRKHDQAKEHGCEILHEDDFKTLIGKD